MNRDMGSNAANTAEVGEAPKCGLCGGAGTSWSTKAGYLLFSCTSCGNGFLPQGEIPAQLEELYSREYFEGKRSTGYPAYLAEAPMLERNFEDRLAWIERLHAPGRILDVGTAYGFFLRVARARGWDAMGVEIAADCAEEAARLAEVPVVAGDFLDADLPADFDVITLFDVIEHMRDPMACLRRAADLLNPGGLLVIETGDVASRWARLLGRHWYFLDPPQHLFYFSAAGLKQALTQCGFSGGTELRRFGRRVSLTNIGFKLQAAAPRSLKRLMGGLGRLPGSVYLKFGDAMVLAARKP